MLEGLSTAEKIRGLAFADPNPKLQAHVRRLLRQRLSQSAPRSLTPPQLKQVTALLLAAGDDAERRALMETLAGSALGTTWLPGRLMPVARRPSWAAAVRPR